MTQILENLGAELVATGSNECCQSDCYFHYVIGRCDIDVISGFRLKTFGTSYYYPYQGNQVELLDLDYVTVPLLPAEALFVLYGMIFLVQKFLEKVDPSIEEIDMSRVIPYLVISAVIIA